MLTKFGLCSKRSEKLNDCSLPRAGKIFATARMLGFSLKHAELKYGATENMLPSFAQQVFGEGKEGK